MTIQLAIDDTLINEACVLGHFATQEEAVINALREFINHRKQQELEELAFYLDCKQAKDENEFLNENEAQAFIQRLAQ